MVQNELFCYCIVYAVKLHELNKLLKKMCLYFAYIEMFVHCLIG